MDHYKLIFNMGLNSSTIILFESFSFKNYRIRDFEWDAYHFEMLFSIIAYKYIHKIYENLNFISSQNYSVNIFDNFSESKQDNI